MVEKRLYNPWGEIVKVQDGAGNNLSKLTFFDRGYTGHQHLESVGLINMNARLYDPKLHRFLSPDNFVQDPYNTQSFNRYGYCWNNPLKFTDKSGELIDVIIIGASIALAAYLTMNLVSGQPITLKGALMATFVGAVSGAVTFGIGSWTANTISNFALKATAQALYHGVFQGTLSGIQGGGFWAGAAAGALSSMASSLYAGGGPGKWQGLGGKFAQSTEGLIAFGTIAGGAGAALTGGNFWQGAVTGLIVSGLNHAMHPSDSYKDGEDDPPGKKSKTQVRKETVKPSAAKLFEVGGNTLSTSELFVDSPMAKFVRNGAPKSGSISKVLKVGGRTLGGIGIGFEAAEVYNGNMSYTEFGIDTGMALVGMTGWGAPVALVYFGGKAIYEYSSGNTLFTKPK